MAKFKLVSLTKGVGSEEEEIIDGNFENEEEVIDSLGGIDCVAQMAMDQQGLSWSISKIDEDEDEE